MSSSLHRKLSKMQGQMSLISNSLIHAYVSRGSIRKTYSLTAYNTEYKLTRFAKYGKMKCHNKFLKSKIFLTVEVGVAPENNAKRIRTSNIKHNTATSKQGNELGSRFQKQFHQLLILSYTYLYIILLLTLTVIAIYCILNKKLSTTFTVRDFI